MKHFVFSELPAVAFTTLIDEGNAPEATRLTIREDKGFGELTDF